MSLVGCPNRRHSEPPPRSKEGEESSERVPVYSEDYSVVPTVTSLE